MKDEKGITLVVLAIIVIATIIVVLAGLKNLNQYMNKQKDEDIKSTMLAIQSVITNIKNKHTVNEEENALVGTKLNLAENETEYEISEPLKSVLLCMQDADLYILNQEELINNGIKNVEINNKVFYVVDYNSEEIVYSLGINEKYKLSEM